MAYVIIYMKSINNKHNLVYIIIINQYMCAYSSKLNYCVFLKKKNIFSRASSWMGSYLGHCSISIQIRTLLVVLISTVDDCDLSGKNRNICTINADDFVDFCRVGSCRQDWTCSVLVMTRLSCRRRSLGCGMSCDVIVMSQCCFRNNH